MKNLTDEELFALAWIEFYKMKKNTTAGTILCVIVIVHTLFVLLIGFGVYFVIPVDIVCFLLYFYHDRKLKKSDKLVKEILEELDKRGI